jgi:hypothetical protein
MSEKEAKPDPEIRLRGFGANEVITKEAARVSQETMKWLMQKACDTKDNTPAKKLPQCPCSSLLKGQL